MESYFIDGSHHLLHEIVCCHQKYRYWHFGILLPSNDPNSLAALLKLTDEAYRTFMCKIGFLKERNVFGKSTISVVKASWEKLKHTLSFQYKDNVYFDQMNVSSYPRGYWIGFGDMGSFSQPTNPSSQFKFHNNPPRITGLTLVKKLKELRLIVELLQNYENDNDNNYHHHDEEQYNFNQHCKENESLSSFLNSTKNNESTLATVANLSQFLQQYKTGQRTLGETNELIVEVIKESI